MGVGTEGIEVGLFKQVLELPWLTVITGVSLLFPTESLRKITTLVPPAIVTGSQVYEVPEMPERTAIVSPFALPFWKVWRKCQNPGSRTRLNTLTRVNGPKISP